jgi:hypothetical protein
MKEIPKRRITVTSLVKISTD